MTTGRTFNDRYETQVQRSLPKSKTYRSGGSSGGLSPRDTSYIITPDDATKKAEDNTADAQRLLDQYGDMLQPGERADLEMIVAGGGRPQEMGLKEGALQALGRLGESFDRPFQLIRHSVASVAHQDIELTGRDFVDIMSGHDERLVERYGEELVGEHGDMSGSQMLRLAGVEEAETGAGKFGRFLGALAIEVALDPLTWMTGGFSGLGKKAALEAMEQAVTRSADDVLRTLARSSGDELLAAASRSSDEALALLDDIAIDGASQLDNHVFEKATAGLREKIKSGKMGEEVVGMDLAAKNRDEVGQLLNQRWLDEVDESMGINRTVGVSKPGGGVDDSFSWKRVDKQLDPKTGEMVDAEMPYNLLVGTATERSWYGNMVNELADVIVNKQFHNPKNYNSWSPYLDHAKAGKVPMWTTGGITFGFGKWQKPIPGLTPATRGVTSRVTRPLLAKTRKGPAFERWTRFRKTMNREGVQMVMAARGQDLAAASYADWAWLRSNQALAAGQTGFIASAWRIVELEDSYRRMIQGAVKPLKKKERDAAAEELGAVIGKAIGSNNAELDLSSIRNVELRQLVKGDDELVAGMLRQAEDLNTIIHDTFGRAKEIMPELEEISGQVQTYIPLVTRTEAREGIKDVLFTGSFPVDVAKLTDDELDDWLSMLTRRAVAAGTLEEGREFSIDHLYHLAALAPASDPAVTLAESIGEKAVLSNRRFGVGGVLVQYTSEHSEDLVADGVRRAFEDQSVWSRELSSFLHALNDEYKMGHKLDFIDVLETNPVVRAQSYVGQLQEAVTERVGLAAAQKVGRARRKSFLYDAGALVALGEGKNGFYRRLSTFLDDIHTLKGGLEHYRTLLGDPTPVNISGVNRYFPPHLAESQEFVDLVRRWDDAFKDAGNAVTLDRGLVDSKIRKVMVDSPSLSEAEAIQLVANEARRKVEDIVDQMGKAIDASLTDAFREVREIVQRHPDEVAPKIMDDAVLLQAKALADAQDQLDNILNQYVDTAMGRKVEAVPVRLDRASVERIVSDAIESGDPAILDAHAAARRDHAASLPDRDPMKARIEADAKTHERTAELLRRQRGEEPMPKRSPVEHVGQGNQNGADRAAGLRAAEHETLTTGGHAPLGFQASEGVNVPEVIAAAESAGVVQITADAIPGRTLTPKEMQGYSARSVANLENHHGTVVVYPAAGMTGKYGMRPSSGSSKTIRYAVHGPGETGLGFNIDYSAAQFLDDFEEMAEAPGVWVLKPGRTPHKPVIVISYQPGDEVAEVAISQARKDMTPAMARKADDELLDRQQRVVQQWFRDNDVKRLNVAGSRARKETGGGGEAAHLFSDYRYGRRQVKVVDPRTGNAVDAVEVRISSKELPGDPMPATVPMDWAQANDFQWEIIIPTLREKNPKVRLDMLREVRANVLARVRELGAAGEAGAAEYGQRYVDSIDQFARILDVKGIGDSSSARAAKRPLTEPMPTRVITLEEAMDAARLQYGDGYNIDIGEGFTLQTAGAKRMDPREFLEVNATVADQRQRALHQGEGGKRTPISVLRKRMNEFVGKYNKTKAADHAAAMKHQGWVEGDPDWIPFHPAVYDEAATKLRAAKIAEESGRQPHVEEAELIMDWVELRANTMAGATYRVNRDLDVRGTVYGGGQRTPMATMDLVIADERSAERLVGQYLKHKDDLTAAGIHHADIDGIAAESMVNDVEILARVWDMLNQLTEPMALEDGSRAVFMQASDLPEFPFVQGEMLFRPEMYEDELRKIARDRGYADWDTAPMASVGYNPWITPGRTVEEAERVGRDLTKFAEPESGLLQRLMDDPVSNREVRRLGMIQDLSMKEKAYADIDARFLREHFVAEVEEGKTVYYQRNAVGEKGERVREAHVTRLQSLATDSTMKYRELLEYATSSGQGRRATPEQLEAADRWFLNEYLVDPGHLEAARKIEVGLVGASPVDPGSQSDILRSWMERNHADRLDEYVADTLDEPMSLQDWTEARYPEMMDWFSIDNRKAKLDADAAGPAKKRRETFAASIEQRRLSEDLPLAWERKQWELFEEAEARRTSEIGTTPATEGVATGQLIPGQKAPAETPWQQWMIEAWEALMRSEGADRQEAFELLEFYHGHFFSDPEMVGRQFKSSADEMTGQARRAQSVHLAGDLDPNTDVGDVLPDISDEMGVSGMKGSEFNEAYVGYDLNDPNMAGELHQGRQISDVNKIHMTEVMNGSSIVFDRGGRIKLPAMFDPEVHRYQSGGYRAPVYGTQASRYGEVGPLGPEVPAEGLRARNEALPTWQEPAANKFEQLEDATRYPIEDRVNPRLDPNTRPRDVEYETVIDDLDEEGMAQRRPTGYADMPEEFNEILFEGAGISATGVNVEAIARKVVDWAADQSDITLEELVDDLRRQAGRDYTEFTLAPYESALREAGTAEFRQVAYDMGLDGVASQDAWRRYYMTGDLNQLAFDDYRYMALARMHDEGSLELGEIALDKVHRLNERMTTEALRERDLLHADAARVRVESGLEGIEIGEVVSVGSFVVAEGKVSKAAVRKRFNLTNAQAEVYLDDLEKRGIVSAKSPRGRRTLTGDQAAVDQMGADVAEDLPNTVAITATEQKMLADMLGTDVPTVVEGAKVRELLLQRERTLGLATKERLRLQQKHSTRRAEDIAAVTQQEIQTPATTTPLTPEVILSTQRAMREDLTAEWKALGDRFRAEVGQGTFSKEEVERWNRLAQVQRYLDIEIGDSGLVFEPVKLDPQQRAILDEYWVKHSPQTTEVAPDGPAPIKVDPSPAGMAQLNQAREAEAALESQVRRLKDMSSRIVEDQDAKVAAAPKAAAFDQAQSSSAVSSRQGMSIAGFVVEDQAAARHMGDNALYAGRKHMGQDNAFGYPEGFLGNPYLYDEKMFARWRHKRHPMLGKKYVTRKDYEGELVEQIEYMPYQLVGTPDEAAALYHESLWDWIEAHPQEAGRLAARMQNERPHLYYIGGESTHAVTSDADVVAEAFADVASGRLERPTNRWANIADGTANQDVRRQLELDAHAEEIYQEMRKRDEEIHERLTRAEKAVADQELTADVKVQESLADVMRAMDMSDASAVVKWMNGSEAFTRFFKLALGEDVSVKAYLHNGKPMLTYSRPGAEIAAVEALDKRGLAAVLERMDLPVGAAEHISPEEAVAKIGPEFTLMHNASVAIKKEAELLKKAQASSVVAQSKKPTIERIAAAEVASTEFTDLMRSVWTALKRRDTDDLMSRFWREVDGELVPSESWERIATVLKAQDPQLLHHVEDMVAMALSAKSPMASTRWKRRVAEMMDTMSTMSTADSSTVMYGQLEQLVKTIDNIPDPRMVGAEIDDLIRMLDALTADGMQAMTYASHYDDATNALVEGFTGPMERMHARYQKAAPGRLSQADAGDRESLVDNLRAMEQWFEVLEKDDRFNRGITYVRDHGARQYSTDLIQERNILKRQVHEILNNPSVKQTEVTGRLVEAGEVGLGGRFGAQYMIDEALGRELAHTVGNISKMTTDHNMRHLLRMSNSVWAWWRRAATISKPSFHIRNFIGGMWNNMLIGVNPASYFDLGPSVMTFQYRMNGAKKLLDTALNPDQTFYKNVLSHLPERHRPLFYNVWKQNVLETAFARGDLGRLPGKTWMKPWKANWVPFQAGGVAMEGVEGLLRVAAFAKYFDPVNPHISGKFGREMVNTVHFDYVNLTQYEERIKKFVPFFVWSRRNIPLQLRTLVQSPRWVISLNKAKRLWNEEFLSEEDDPMLADLGFATPWGRENDLGWARLMFMPDLPVMDIFDSPLFGGRQLGPTPFGEDSRNIQKWAIYGLQLAGPALTIPHDFLSNEDKTTIAPTGLNEMLALMGGLSGLYAPSASGDITLPKFVDSALNSMIPFYQDYRAATGAQANNPYRAAREGMLPGEQQMFNVPGDNMALGMMRTFGRGAGFQWATPMDQFFSNRELERLIDEIQYRVRTRGPEAALTQPRALEEAALYGG